VRKLEEWLDLFTDDVLYFMPRRNNVPPRELHRELTPLGDLAILEEDRRYLEIWVARLDTGMALGRGSPVTHPASDRQSRGAAGGERRVKVARRTIVLHANVLLDKTSASSSMGQNLISVIPLTAKRALAEIDHNGR
jgi:hypothetical protein